ncbi:MAG TPA: helical backbone metal receptor [Candidatus Hydrogenedentes bacterium]|nr:helical backbone metal receptor [Candidatus Hydrogenedentota bacterium]
MKSSTMSIFERDRGMVARGKPGWPRMWVCAIWLCLAWGCAPDPSGVGDQSTPDIPPNGYTRVVSLAPSLTETLFAIGAGDRVIGVTRFCAWPAEATRRPQVGGFLDTNYEAIVALKPDLVVALPSHGDHVDRLKALNLRCVIVSQTTLKDILDSIPRLGALTDRTESAEQLARTLQQQLEHIRELVRDTSPPRVLLSSGRNPADNSLSEVYIVGRKSFLNDLLEIAGGENAYVDPSVEYPMLSAEGIIRLDPEVIIEFVTEKDPVRYPDSMYLEPWHRLGVLTAAQHNRIYLIRGPHHTIPGPSVWQTAREIARLLHPDRFKDGGEP